MKKKIHLFGYLSASRGITIRSPYHHTYATRSFIVINASAAVRVVLTRHSLGGNGAMRRSADLLVFASGVAIGEVGVENGALGCEAARRINSCIGVFRSDLLREYPEAGISLVGLGFGGSSPWEETLCFVFS